MSGLMEKIAAGSAVITANSRLALHVHKAFEIWQIAQGNCCWHTPQVSPWPVWLQQQWRELEFQCAADLPLLLTAEQSQLVWEDVIQSSPCNESLLNIPATARSAMQAWQLLQQWNLTYKVLANEENPDSRVFYQWAKTFQQRCHDHNWLDADSLPDRLCVAWQSGALAPPSPDILLLRFDALTPQHQSVIDALIDHGTRLEQFEPDLPTTSVSRQACADSPTEIRQVALWLRYLLQQDADLPIGVVVPDLASRKTDIEHIFDEVLLPEAALDLGHRPVRPYNISLGRPLAQFPAIQIALTLLRVAAVPATLADWRRLLLTPYLAGGDSELSQRAQLDAVLHRYGGSRWHLDDVLHQAETRNCTQWAALLQRLRQGMTELPIRQSPAAWANSFQQLLQQAGWPGERSLDSETYQTVQAWKKALSSFASLSRVTANLTFRQALKHLQQVTNTRLHQPQSRHEPVQVLGALEAAGVEFRHCWIMGLHDGAWPLAPRPNPFLPIALQRQHGMPHASAERELAYAGQLSRRLFATAPEVIVSYPCREGDNALRPSPLIASLPALQQAPWLEGIQLRYRDQLFQSSQLETYSDWQAPELARGTAVRGGTSIFRDQAACPFRAFARHRLNASGIDQVESGLNAAERGNLVHSLMEAIWQSLQDQNTLIQLDADALYQRVETVVAQVIAAQAYKYPQLSNQRFAALEQTRLLNLALALLQLERQRAPFTVAALEQERQVSLAGLEMKIKADRIDRLASGGEMIIDYKTGTTSINDWYGERPDEPQLPLYAITSQHDVTAVAFATLRPGEVSLKGISRDKDIAKGIKPPETDWYVLKNLWHERLMQLGENFRQGQADVDPKDAFTWNSKACSYCDLGPLCRINELADSDLSLPEDADEHE